MAFTALSSHAGTTTVQALNGNQIALPTGEQYTITNNNGLYANGKDSSGTFSSITGDNITITVTNSTSYSGSAVKADNGGHITLSNASLSSTGSNSGDGINASGTDTVVKVTGQSTIHALGTAIYTGSGAKTEIDGATITSDASVAGLWISGSGSNLTIKNSDVKVLNGNFQIDNGGTLHFENSTVTNKNGISMTAGAVSMLGTDYTTTANYAYGVNMGSNTSSTIENSSITTQGTGADAIWAPSSGATITLTNTTIETHGDTANAVELRSGASATITGGSITTHGNNAHGLYAANGTAANRTSINASNLTINVDDIAFGVLSWDKANVELNTVQLNMAGNDARGLYIQEADAAIKATNVTVQMTGNDAYGVYQLNRGVMELTGSIIRMTGNDSTGYLSGFSSYTGNYTNYENITNSTIDVDTGRGIALVGGNHVLNLTRSSLIVRGNTDVDIAILATDSSGVTPLLDTIATADASTITGDVVVSTANTSATFTLNLTNTSTLTGAVQSVSELNLDNTSRWNVTADSALTTLKNQGSIVYAAPTAGTFTTITVSGDYTGTDGQLTMNTALSDDSSATDKLIVTGDTSGTTYVTVNNAGGTGALTGNGIELIHVGGDSNGTFTQQGRIIADGYGYTLYKGSLSDPSDGNWYLRSVALPTPPTPDPDSGPVPKTGWVDPTVGAYLGNQTAAVNMFSHSLHDRLGEPQFTEANKTNGLTTSVWVRVIGSTQDSKAAQQTLDLSTDTTVVQIGADLAQWSGTGNDRWHLGLMAGYGHSKTDASHPKDYGQDYLRNAKGTVDGYSIGVYATWYGNASLPSGPYVDTWVQYGWFDNDVSASGINTDSYKSRNLSASVEAGYAFTLSDNGSRQWMIEPQAQLIFNRYDVDDHVTSYGSKVHNADANGLTSRVGARLYSRPVAGNGVQPFVELNWLHGDAENSLQFGSNAFSHDMPEDRYEVKAGLQAKLSKNWHGWASVGWQTGNNDYQQLEGLAGVKYLW